MLSSTPSPNVRVVQHVFDIKAWLLPQVDELHGHSTPHCFKFIKKSGFEDVLMYSKLWSSDAWCSETEAIIPLKVSTSNREFGASVILDNKCACSTCIETDEVF